MKNRILLIVISIVAFFETIDAQYLPVLSSNTTTFGILVGVPDATISGKIEINGDTTLNGNIYKKVWYQVEFHTPTVVGFARQNAENSKLYFFDSKSMTEYLVMNLELNVGDDFIYLNTSECENTQGIITAKVVSVGIVNGRKQITFDKLSGGGFFCDTLKFIEGFGPNSSIFFQSPFLESEFPGLAYKVCKKLENNVLSYPTSTIDFCENTTSSKDVIKQEQIITSPNPFKNNVILKTNTGAQISIFDILGRLKYHAIISSDNMELDTTDWQLGFYYVLANGKITKTIVKQ